MVELKEVIDELIERTKAGQIKWSDFDRDAGWMTSNLRYELQVFPTYRRFDITVRELREEEKSTMIRDAEEIMPLIDLLMELHPRQIARGKPYGLKPAELDDEARSVLQQFWDRGLGIAGL